MKEHSEDTAHLLWTSGWDSTFRLLQVVLSQRRRVQPYYLIDSYRASTGIEIKTMRLIKNRLFSKDAETKRLILPTIFKEVWDLQPNKELTDKYRNIKKRQHIGSQYEWLARFCEEHDIYRMETGNHDDGTIQKLLEGKVVLSESENEKFYRVDEKFVGTDEYELFKYYRLPILNLTKLDMQRISKEQGWDEFMDMTWFCHRPRPDLTACGICNPCAYTIKAGLGSRIPFKGRLRYYSRKVLLRR